MRAVLFDMDGVLVDVSRSYRAAARGTAEFFLRQPVAPELIQEYKDRGGANNDWDLVESLLRDRGFVIERETLVGIFQRIYLGHDWNGLICRERWLADRSMLDRLHERAPTGIVTGRPRPEAEYALDRFGMRDCFDEVITMDDLPREKQKPHPGGILRAMKRLNVTDALYLGDTADDMRAARRAGAEPIGVIAPCGDPGRQRKLLDRAGARRVLESVNHLEEVFS